MVQVKSPPPPPSVYAWVAEYRSCPSGPATQYRPERLDYVDGEKKGRESNEGIFEEGGVALLALSAF